MFIALPVRRLPSRALVALCCVFGAAALAQPPAKIALTAAADPGHPGAPVRPLVHVSVFGSYRSFTEAPVSSWRDANELTERIGGWRAYAREAQAPQASPGHPAAPAPANAVPNPASSPGAAGPHPGHTRP